MDCPICFNPFDSSSQFYPHSLPCGHTFCFSCISQFHKATPGSIACPNCKQRNRFANASDVPKNFIFLEALENFQKQKVAAESALSCCQICEERNAATHHCLTCEEILCEKHKALHLKFKVSKNHQVIALSTLNSPFTSKSSSIVAIKSVLKDSLERLRFAIQPYLFFISTNFTSLFLTSESNFCRLLKIELKTLRKLIELPILVFMIAFFWRRIFQFISFLIYFVIDHSYTLNSYAAVIGTGALIMEPKARSVSNISGCFCLWFSYLILFWIKSMLP